MVGCRRYDGSSVPFSDSQNRFVRVYKGLFYWFACWCKDSETFWCYGPLMNVKGWSFVDVNHIAPHPPYSQEYIHVYIHLKKKKKTHQQTRKGFISLLVFLHVCTDIVCMYILFHSWLCKAEPWLSITQPTYFIDSLDACDANINKWQADNKPKS